MAINKCCLLIGNSRWHWAVEENNDWIFYHSQPDISRLESLKIPLSSWAAVGSIPNSVIFNKAKEVQVNDIPLLKLPPWLGVDRALAAWGGIQKLASSRETCNGLLIADAGTILSITRIKFNKEFAGGLLIPGLNLQLSAMASGTKNLKNPASNSFSKEDFPFATTEAMKKGVIQALVGALIEAKEKANMPIWVCGGDSKVIVKELEKRNIHSSYHPNLVMEGLVDINNRLLKSQDQKESPQQ